jgi:sugar transferase EpsL
MGALYRRWGKRVFDVVTAALALLLLAPVLVITATLVRLLLGSPVRFLQERPGLHGIAFTLLKFRTMTDVRDREGKLLPDALRLTRLGRFLRSSSLDELPELWNVLRGDMSLVGPRPLLMHYLERYSPEQARRHETRPGITGWAQVNGRNALNWERRLELDVWYVDNCSMWLDLKILAWTVWEVLVHRGINHPGSTTMPEFQGEQSSKAPEESTA